MILDVGCGKRKRGDIGVDYSRNSQADVICDAHHLPFMGAVFAEVRSYVCLEHSPNPLHFLKEQKRVLRHNGKLTCETDNAQYYRWSVQKYAGSQHENYHKDHYMIFYPENVFRLMKLAGLKIKKMELRETTVKQAGSAGKTAYRHWILEKRMHFQQVHS